MNMLKHPVTVAILVWLLVSFVPALSLANLAGAGRARKMG